MTDEFGKEDLRGRKPQPIKATQTGKGDPKVKKAIDKALKRIRGQRDK